MKRLAVLLYGVVGFLLTHLTVLYLIGFVGNLFVPKSIDGALQVPLWQALLTDTFLITVFCLQHSLMARPQFKKWWTQWIPEPIERSTYVIFTFLALGALFYFWQPLGGIIWQIKHPVVVGVIWGLFVVGWLMVVLSTFLINHFDLFGLRQVWLYAKGKPYSDLKFTTPLLYKMVRHPLYLGLMIGFWAAPTMSATRLFFAVSLTLYIFRAIRWEESDLIAHFGDTYRQYMKMVPRVIPFVRKRETPVQYETIIKKES